MTDYLLPTTAASSGHGAVFTREGHHELEASIMSGGGQGAVDQGCGACMLVRKVKNPIRLARLVMEKSPHVTLSG